MSRSVSVKAKVEKWLNIRTNMEALEEEETILAKDGNSCGTKRLDDKLNKIDMLIKEERGNMNREGGDCIPHLECPICFELLDGTRPIYQCVEGHLICQTCSKRKEIRNCPICRRPVNGNWSRTRVLEDILRIGGVPPAPPLPTTAGKSVGKDATEDSAVLEEMADCGIEVSAVGGQTLFIQQADGLAEVTNSRPDSLAEVANSFPFRRDNTMPWSDILIDCTNSQGVYLDRIPNPYGECQKGRYYGEMVGGLPSGYGRLEYERGPIYSGSFKDGYKNGKGQLVWPNRDCLVGEWLKGELDGWAIISTVKEGKRRELYSKGERIKIEKINLL